MVRLHVLGDFYSAGYVEPLAPRARRFPALHVFGFTARDPTTRDRPRALRSGDGRLGRFAVRFSGASRPLWASRIGDDDPEAIACPAQTGATECCATCALCWQSLSIFDATALAISTEETRYYLNGVFFHAPDGHLCAVSTDGHRLSRMTVPLPDGAAEMPDIIVARKSVRELRRLLATIDPTAAVPLEIGTGKMNVQIGGTRLVAKLIDGTFPDYTRVIPTENGKLLTVHSTEWVRCIRAASAVCTERTRAIRLDLSSDGCQAVGQSTEGGNALEPIDADFSDKTMLQIGVNSRYAADVGAMFGEAATLKFAFADMAAPILITSDDKPALTAVLMPMRVPLHD
jgi:hypothetical protein